jgi:hypothetical protein
MVLPAAAAAELGVEVVPRIKQQDQSVKAVVHLARPITAQTRGKRG